MMYFLKFHQDYKRWIRSNKDKFEIQERTSNCKGVYVYNYCVNIKNPWY